MKTITFGEIFDIISKLDREENENLYKYMQINPHDEQRTRDHIITNGAYCRVLSAIHEAAKQ